MRPTRYPEQPKDNCWVKPSTLRQISARRHRTGYPAERSFPADSAPPHLGAHTRTSRAHAAQPICQARGPTGDTKQSRHPTTASPEHIRTENQNYSHSRWFTASRAKRRDQPKAKKGLPDFRPTGPCTCFPLPKPLCADKRLQRGQEAGHIAPAHEQRDADEDDAADVGERMVAPLAKALAVGDVHHEERHDG